MDNIDSLAKALIKHGMQESIVKNALDNNDYKYLKWLYDNLPWVSDDIEF